MNKPRDNMQERWAVGCMTGTSLDGLDVALVRITGHELSMKAQLVAHQAHPLGALRDTLLDLAAHNARPAADYLRAARGFGQLHAEAVRALCDEHLPSNATPAFVAAHGQTICHLPGEGLSWQLFDPWPVARGLHAAVVHDLRQADLAAGGEGAPITPIADWLMFGDGERDRAVVNLGGVCNLTRLPAHAGAESVTGCDVGPCNLLLDGLAQRLLGITYDDAGQHAASGGVDQATVALIRRRIDEAIRRSGSLGREQFSRDWLDALVGSMPHNGAAHDVLASAVDSVARCIVERGGLSNVHDVILAGGGARNAALVDALRRHAPKANVLRSDAHGIAVEAREAVAMAVLGALSQDRCPITLPQVTGAHKPGVAGTWTFPTESCGQATSTAPTGGGADCLGERGHLATEQRLADAASLDAMSIDGVLALMNAQDMTVARTVHGAIPAIAQLTRRVVDALERDGRLIYVGAGTSGRLGALDAAECPPTFHSDPEQVIGVVAGGERALREAVEGAEDDRGAAQHDVLQLQLNERDVVVGIAAGGTTPYVWAALEAAKARGAVTGLITCAALEHAADADARAALDHAIELPVGAEVVTGSTRLKAGTATKLTLNMISTAAFVQRGKTWGNLMVDLRATNAKLRDRALRILLAQTSLSKDEALRTLEQAHGRVKAALVMAKLDVTYDQAQAKLRETVGHLRPLLGAPAD